jgi:predicted enzyme involved in methoxymalonyl-ACP biosynthesis
MGRKIEHAMVHLAVEYARERKAKQVEARFIETSKNKPCHEFWIHSGFASDGERFLWNCEVPYELPSFIKVEERPN